MNLETIWMYTGFAVLTSLAWVAAGFLIWVGIKVVWSVWKKWGNYRRVMKLLHFLDENKECNDKFEEWLMLSDDEIMSNLHIWRWIRRQIRRHDGRG